MSETTAGEHARMLSAESKIRENAELAREIGKDLALRLQGIAPTLVTKPEVFFKNRNSEQEYDTRYHVGVAQTFRAGLFRSLRYKLLQVHLHGNFQTVVARITVPEGHPFEDGIQISSADMAADIFSSDYLVELLKGQAVAAQDAFEMWKSEGRRFSIRRNAQ